MKINGGESGFFNVVVATVVAFVFLAGGIRGYFYLTKNDSKISDVTDSSATLTASWKTYRNEKYGFEMQHPHDWQVRENKDSFVINRAKNFELPYESGGISISKNQSFSRDLNQDDCKNFVFAGRQAKDCFPAISFAGERVVLLQTEDGVFEITDYTQSDTTAKILSTFKFVEGSPIL